MNVKTIGIIGSGVAGVTAAKSLQNSGFACEIFEKSQKLGVHLDSDVVIFATG